MRPLRKMFAVGFSLISLSLAFGCQIPMMNGAPHPNVVVSFGNLSISPTASLAIAMRFDNKGNVSIQDLQISNVQQVVVTVTGPNLVHPITATVTREHFDQNKAIANFSNLPEGPVTVSASALDINGKVLSHAFGSATIVNGQTALLTLFCQTTGGNLQVIYNCPDCSDTSPSPTPTNVPSYAPVSEVLSKSLINKRYAHNSIQIHGKIYVIGGVSGIAGSSDALRTIEVINIDSSGNILEVTSLINQLNTPRCGHGLAVIGDYLYVIGGDSNTWIPYKTIERAIINTDGTLGPFEVVSSQLNFARVGSECQVIGKYLYVMGGFNDVHGSSAYQSIERAEIYSDGSIGEFEQISSKFVQGRYYFASEVIDSRFVYVFGGRPIFPGGTWLSSVERAEIHRDGSLGDFVVLSQNMVNARYSFDSLFFGRQIFLIGGFQLDGSSLSSIEVASINDDGSLGPFSLTQNSLIYSRAGLSAAKLGTNAYIIDGYNGTALGNIERLSFN
ncbi:Kelch motif protein [compost metagenome]